ncbi:MAG: rRNA maturation RNase YbeY [Flavobacteriales bacterium]|nr:rRNA maturation RNase YbeY [Flavobacteriales bacterium]
MAVSFHSEQIDFSFSDDSAIAAWLLAVCSSEAKKPSDISYIFCSDDYLLEMNRQYLNHDYYTDVITFDYCTEDHVSGDIFISIDRVVDNAQNMGVSSNDELHRVMVHGLLHLLGYQDKEPSDKEQMTAKEDFYLSLRPF